ncbi:MAG: exodeoxyribonuclease V subunit beta [Neisseriaceae bacterium]|nr:exodeoxyribonuclease V subunit beta [Neisseriaceae bacterium]
MSFNTPAPYQPFDPLTVPIEGVNLVEASAGTGKTWSIAALYLRLVLQQRLPVASILVVTYTRAATAELKSRLRARLNEALYYLEARLSDEQVDDFLVTLLGQLEEPVAQQILRLKAAISQFDNAAIYTIHGFCQRVLKDSAFVCASPFQVNLVQEQDDILLRLAEDFWRGHVSHDALWARLVYQHSLDPQALLMAVKPHLSKPYLVTETPDSTLTEAIDTLQAKWLALSEADINAMADQFWAIHACLNGNKYRKTTFEAVFQRLLRAKQDNQVTLLLEQQAQLLKLDEETLLAGAKKGMADQLQNLTAFAPLRPLLQALDQYQSAIAAELTRLKLAFLTFLNEGMQAYNRTHQQRRFDDLLLDLGQAINHPNQGEALAASMAKEWQVALIDEFQDTDPIQYDIFQQAFVANQRPLFLVGDPKQAIYKFRGADIFAYLDAAKSADHRYTLATNFRSHAALVDGIGQLFTRHPQPFLLPYITYNEVKADRAEPVVSPYDTPIQTYALNLASDEKPNLTKDVARARSADFCAQDIADKLAAAAIGHYRLGATPLQAGDIAVLVSTHNQGKQIAQALRARDVDSVSLSQESVFASHEAKAIYELLAWWLNPTKNTAMRLVLANLFFGYTAEAIHALNQDEARALMLIEEAQAAHELWQRKGVFYAYQHFVSRHQIPARLLSQKQDRSLTNLTQLMELLSEEAPKHFSVHGLHEWLQQQIIAAHEGKARSEAAQLRLESDEHLVKIITIHASKGLQYPLVYCPYLWDAKSPSRQQQAFYSLHHAQKGTLLLTEEQVSDADREQVLMEQQAEQLRLLYVALTRAKELLVINLGNQETAEHSALQYLLSQQPLNFDTEGHYFKLMPTPRAEATLVPQGTDGQHYTARHYAASARPFVLHTSFSSLSRHTQVAANQDEVMPQLDPAEHSTLAVAATADIDLDTPTSFTFPKGAHAGVCLHSLLEHYDFRLAAAEQPNIDTLRDILAQSGFASEWYEPLMPMLDATSHAQLNVQQHSQLCQVDPAKRLDELSFLFSATGFNLSQLKHTLRQSQFGLPTAMHQAIDALTFKEVNGYINGFIDLICQDQLGAVYVIDYKSNHLGYHSDDYTPEALVGAMAEHHYYLQAMLYAVATRRYFRSRQQPLPTIHIRYLFLRGLLPDSQNGIWSWDLDEDLLDQLEACFH